MRGDTASRNIVRKITKMLKNASNEEQRRTSVSIHCKDPFFPLVTHCTLYLHHAEELDLSKVSSSYQ